MKYNSEKNTVIYNKYLANSILHLLKITLIESSECSRSVLCSSKDIELYLYHPVNHGHEVGWEGGWLRSFKPSPPVFP